MRRASPLLLAGLLTVAACAGDDPVESGPVAEDTGPVSADGRSDAHGSADETAAPGDATDTEAAADTGAEDTSAEDTGAGDNGADTATEPTCPLERPQPCPAGGGCPAACWPAGTRCASLHFEPDGSCAACTGTDEAFLDADGHQACCGADTVWCPPDGAHPGSCQPVGSDCGTTRQCGGGAWEACPTGAAPHCAVDGTLRCCAASRPLWCPPAGDAPGLCAENGADCQTAFACAGAWDACPAGATGHCLEDGSGLCCPTALPVPCPAGFCGPEGADCDAAIACGDAQVTCAAGRAPHCTSDDHLACCGGPTALWCPPTDAHPGFCARSDADCGTAEPCGGGWAACPAGQATRCAQSGEAVCCGAEEPVFCGAEGFCAAEGTDCQTALDCGSGWAACPAGSASHCGGSTTICCGGATPLYCEAPGFCAAEGADCATAAACDGLWFACETGEVGHCGGAGPACCGGATPLWCAPGGGAPGLCAQPWADCATARTCDAGDSWGACDTGSTSHCDAGGGLVCCGGETGTFCPPASGFPGACLPTGTNCGTVEPDGADGWVGCLLGQVPSHGTDGTLVCCGGDTPATCALGSGLGGDFDGSVCFPADVDCASLARVGGTWAFCRSGEAAALSGTGALLCCGGATPVLCAPGSALPDGDAAEALATALFGLPASDCSDACQSDSDCAPPPPEVIPFRCKAPLLETCNRCVADNQAVVAAFPGGCFPAGQSCDALHHCGGVWQTCPGGGCFCVGGTLYNFF